MHLKFTYILYKMDFTSDAKDLKETAHKCMWHKGTKTSERVFAAFVYGVIRMGEILDWWFPVKVTGGNKIN